MNIQPKLPRFIALALLAAIMLVLSSISASAAERVGTYDSRLVAFAAFWDDAHQTRLKVLIQEARTAKETGDHVRFKSLDQELSALQHELHMQVFSTAPIDAVLAGLSDRLPALLRETGVSRLVSQWDEPALAGVPAADRVDVTERLLREFHLPAARQKHLDQLRTVKPLPLERARLLSQQNKL
jgi:hypothetical protein